MRIASLLSIVLLATAPLAEAKPAPGGAATPASANVYARSSIADWTKAPEPGPEPPLVRLRAEDLARGEPPPWLVTACPDPLGTALSVEGGAGGVVLIADPRSAPAQRAESGGPGCPLGSTAAFSAVHQGRVLTFETFLGGARDRETGSRWNALGEARAGPLAGAWLEPLPQVGALRFALEAGQRGLDDRHRP